MSVKVIILTLKDKSRVDNIKILSDLLNPIFDIEIFYGVDGSRIQIEDTNINNIKSIFYEGQSKLYDKTVRINKQEMKKGEFGASWSHIYLYEKLLRDDKYDFYLIFEDDAQFVRDIESFLKILNEVPEDFDFIHLALSDWYPFLRKETVNDSFYIPVKRYFNRLTSYIVSKNGAKKLLERTKNYINIPCDDLISSTYLKSDFILYVPNEYFFSHNDNLYSSITNQINLKS